jgi:hypothetical protein
MNEIDTGDLPLDWRINCSMQITRWWLHSADPVEDFREWLAEAAEGDEPYMRYAMRSFEQTSHLNYVELEERMAMLVRWARRRQATLDGDAT